MISFGKYISVNSDSLFLGGQIGKVGGGKKCFLFKKPIFFFHSNNADKVGKSKRRNGMSKKEGTSELEAGDETKKLEIIGNAKEKGNE